MIFGMTLPVFTAVHVAISLIAIGSGLIVAVAMLGSIRLDLLTTIFLVATALTSITGFFFPWHGVTPGIVLGVLSLAVLLPAFLARYTFHLTGHWRWVYSVSAVVALYFNMFVLIAQAFQKVPALKAFAPKGSEPAFLVTQLVCLGLFVGLGVFTVRKFHPGAHVIVV